jgi:hypothetical protein
VRMILISGQGGAVSTPRASRRLTVDGEVFDVRPSADGRGFHFDWVSGPNPGYGFSTGGPLVFVPDGQQAPAAAPPDDRDLVAHIRLFLEQIDPDTGYIAD